MRTKPVLLAGLMFFISTVALPADEPSPADRKVQALLGTQARTFELWPDKAPDEPRPIGAETVAPSPRKADTPLVTNVSRPTITLLAPQNADRPTPAVIVCPGGGYGVLSIQTEGTDVVKLLVEHGITGIMLKYRVPKRNEGFPQHHQAHQDLQRAVRLVRHNAEAWKIDPKHVGVLGFSAGGHLAATLCNNYQASAYSRLDAADDLPCRPDFAILVYPAYLTDPVESDQLAAVLNIDRLSSAATPPTFIAVAQSDKFARGAIDYYHALRQAKVSGELHVYDGGGHGNGLREPPLGEWGQTSLRWLAGQFATAPANVAK